MASRTFRNANGNLYVRYVYFNDEQWRTNYNWLNNDWNGNNPAALLATFSRSLPALGRVLFLKLPTPSAEHSSHFIE